MGKLCANSMFLKQIHQTVTGKVCTDTPFAPPGCRFNMDFIFDIRSLPDAEDIVERFLRNDSDHFFGIFHLIIRQQERSVLRHPLEQQLRRCIVKSSQQDMFFQFSAPLPLLVMIILY